MPSRERHAVWILDIRPFAEGVICSTPDTLGYTEGASVSIPDLVTLEARDECLQRRLESASGAGSITFDEG